VLTLSQDSTCYIKAWVRVCDMLIYSINSFVNWIIYTWNQDLMDKGLSMGRSHLRLRFRVSIGYMEYWIGAKVLLWSTPHDSKNSDYDWGVSHFTQVT
jgi:hypothetical protein